MNGDCLQCLWHAVRLQSPPLLIIGEDADGHVTYSGLVKDVCDWLFDEKSNTT